MFCEREVKYQHEKTLHQQHDDEIVTSFKTSFLHKNF